MSRRYDSFLLRWWRLGSGAQRIEIEHIPSGEKALVLTLAAALTWITARGGAPRAAGEEFDGERHAEEQLQ